MHMLVFRAGDGRWYCVQVDRNGKDVDTPLRGYATRWMATRAARSRVKHPPTRVLVEQERAKSFLTKKEWARRIRRANEGKCPRKSGGRKSR